jgi:hypothetical protein
VDLDGKVGATQFALVARNACLGIGDLYDKSVHFKDLGGAEFNANAAPLAVPFDDFNICFCTAHSDFSPLCVLTVAATG